MGKCYNSIVVNAPADEVWQALRNFHDMSWAPNVVTGIDAVGDFRADQIGARRVLNGVFQETLLGLNDLERELVYSIDDGPGAVSREAVSNYVGRVSVKPVTAGIGAGNGQTAAFVQWTSSYDSADDSAVGELCNPIYQALLQALQQHFN